ncbi:MAG: [protein-PII] uridylyltransferase [Thermodesulfobacteriota bacterium]
MASQKHILKVKREALEDLWRQGTSGRKLLERQTETIDVFLQEQFGKMTDTGGLALVALGGYGRRELFPFSDIDLLLLYDEQAKEKLDTAAQYLFYPLWDAGLEVGHGVRNLDACLADAALDFFFQVALLDSRLLAGEPTLYADLWQRFSTGFIEGNRRNFLSTMEDHRLRRLGRFGMHTYLLEPHIKESRGGLRDLQAMLWTARVVFGLSGLAAMEDAGLLAPHEGQAIDQAWEKLIRIRNRLHYASGRKNDQLYFEHQEEMAGVFGYRKKEGLLAVEQFMRDVHDAMQTIAVAADLFFEHADEVAGLEGSEGAAADVRLEAGITIRHGRVHLPNPNLLRDKPQLMMRVFHHAAERGLPIHHRTRKHIQENAALVDERLRRSKRMSRAFIDILQQPAAAEVLEVMLETGFLAAWLPEFAPIGSLAQHDVYHINTVDRHLIQSVAEMHALAREEARVFDLLTSPHILFLAALLHDIGKGTGHGHAERGAVLVRALGARLGLPEKERDCLAFLVEHHLFLIHTALRRDLEDERLIIRCARKVMDPDRLAMLYLLTIADARATGPTVWNDWKAALVLDLYLKIAHLLDRSDLRLRQDDQEAAVQWMENQVQRQIPGASSDDFARLSPDYLVSFSPQEVAHHLALRETLAGGDFVIEPVEKNGHWSLLLMTMDRPGLLSKICGVLALHNLRILAAQIFTWQDGTVVDVIEVESAVEAAFAEQDWQALNGHFRLAVNNRLGLDYRIHKKLAPLGFRRRRSAPRREARVDFDNAGSDLCTIVEVYADDRIGLLYEVTRTLADFAINILRARIGSRGDQVVDVFYVQDGNGAKIDDPEYQEEIRRALLHVATHESRDRQM